MSLSARVLTFAACAIACAATLSVHAQQQDPNPMDAALHPRFEVATIKVSDPDDKNTGFHTEGTRLYYENETMQDLLAFAYKVNWRQIAGAPDWFTSKHFDVRGRADQPGIPSVAQQQEMLRMLLEERYGLKVHHDHRDMTRVVITLAKGGPKLTPTERKDFLPDVSCYGRSPERECVFSGVSMDLFAEAMEFFVDRPVMNQTGLQGKFDFKLKYTPADAPASTDASAAPSLFTAMAEQAGLHAESSKGLTDVIVVDHVELPSAD